MKNYNFLPQRYVVTRYYKKIKSYRLLLVILFVFNVISLINLYTLVNENKDTRQIIKAKINNNTKISSGQESKTNQSAGVMATDLTADIKELSVNESLKTLNTFIEELTRLKAIITNISFNDRNITIELTAIEKEQYFNILTFMDSKSHLKLAAMIPLPSEDKKVHFKVILEELK